MRKVIYIVLAMGLTFYLLTGCKKTVIQTDGYEAEITPVMDYASITEKAKEDEDKEPEDIDVNNKSDYNFNYETPLKLSENLFDYTLKIDNNYYQLPAPVNAFLLNGWEFDDNMQDYRLKALEDQGEVTMIQAGKKISVRIANYDEEEHIYKDCVVVSVKCEGDIIETALGTLTTIPEISSMVDDYTEEGIHYSSYMIKDNLYCTQGYFFDYVDNQLQDVEVSYYYTDADREKRKQTISMNWENDTVVYPEISEMIKLDLDTVYRIDLDNDGTDDSIDAKAYSDTDGVYSIIINGEPTMVYEDLYYFEHLDLLKTSDGNYLAAICYGGVNDYDKTDLYQIKNNHIRMTDSVGGRIVSYTDQVLKVKGLAEFDGFSDYEDTYVLSYNGRLSQQGDSVLNHTHIALSDFNAYLYNSNTMNIYYHRLRRELQ